ncbi:GxxExxY protein [Pelosinus fermentans]|uniref:GxxExxY protein n=1 Tax=Pelosinus fermentans TaxID=365349 RepID=UPI0002685C15|nr:GxxExxY protein [Pelosinus fermentans]OAM92762.1 GxxExxY protein [Pelosinus fermentans DSM 17108]SDQ56095.1 GxxExxY protein [Pelosinus fermentans]
MDWRGSLDDDIERLASQMIGSAIEVHRILGPGYIEHVYEEALARELHLRTIPFERQKIIDIRYKGFPIGEGRLDLLIDQRIIVELKSVENLLPIHNVQVHSYLKATGLQLGLLINFNVPLLRDGIKRIILT